MPGFGRGIHKAVPRFIRKAPRRTHRRDHDVALVLPGRDTSQKSPLPLFDQDMVLTRVETPRVWGVPCPHASRRCPP